jgi:hypothetical protein
MGFEGEQTYEVKVINYGLSESKQKKTPCVWVEFGKKENLADTIMWTGWLTPKALEYTASVLFDLEWNESFEDVGKGKSSGALSTEKVVQVVTAEESWTDDNGDTRSRIKVKWINDPGAARFEQLTPESVKTLDKTYKADVAAIKARLGIKSAQDDVPF